MGAVQLGGLPSRGPLRFAYSVSAMNVSLTSFQQATVYYSVRNTEAANSPSIKAPDNSEKRSFVRDLDAFSAFFERLKSDLTENVGIRKISKLSHAKVTSSEALVLADSSSPTTLKSTESINTALSNFFSPPEPAFSGASTSSPEVTGAYDGSLNEDTLTVTVTQEGNVGGPFTGALGLFPADLELEVRASDNSLVDTLSFSESDAENTPQALSIGISIQFSNGSLVLGDSFEINLSQSDLETANTSGSMKEEVDGSTNANFDPGLFVVDGTFDLNGVTISVDESASIDDVLTLITNSAAGVSASYNATTDEIELTQKSNGSAGQIALDNDTSGFLVATKLSGAVSVPGTESAVNAKISDVPEFSSITSGNLTLNGVEVAFDTAADSLQDVMTRIQESAAEITVSFSNGFMTLQSQRVDMGLSLQDNGTGFFDVFSVEEGTFEGENSRVIHGLRKGAEILRKQLGRFEEQLSELLKAEGNTKTATEAKSLRDGLKTSVLESLKNTLNLNASDVESYGIIDTGMGITFDFSDSADSLIDIDYNEMLDSLRKNPKRLMRFLFQEQNDQKESGLLQAIGEHLDVSKRKFARALGVNSGLNLDVFA